VRPGSAIGAVLRFHARVGVRLSLRAAAPLIGIFVAVIGLADLPESFLLGIAASLVAPGVDPIGATVLAALALTLTGWAAPRIAHGLGGWIRHLPADGATHRRAVLLALALAPAPMLAVVLLLTAGLGLHGGTISIAKIAGLPLLALGAATASLPVRRRLVVSGAGALASALALMGRWDALAASALCLVAADRLAGAVRAPRRAPRLPFPSGAPFGAIVAWRATGSSIAGAFVVPLAVLAFCALFLANNPLPPSVAAGGVRFGGILAAVSLIASLAANLSAKRPVWPWARSLPWSASRRVAADALFLGLHAAPLVAIAALLDPLAAVAVAAAIPTLATRAAGSLRFANEIRIGAGGLALAEGFVVAGVIALLPWSAALALAAAPFALRRAAGRDRAQKVGRWIALHHEAGGDSLSWSG